MIATWAGAAGPGPQEPPVGGQGGPCHDRGRAAAAGQRRRLGQGGQGAGIVGLLLNVAEPDEQIGAFGAGRLQGRAVVERLQVPSGRFGRGQLPGRVITGCYRPVAGLLGHRAQGILPRDLRRQVHRGRAGLLGEHLGRLRVQPPAPAPRQARVHGAGDQDVHEPQRPGAGLDFGQQPGGLGHVQGVHRVALGDPGHVDHRARVELRAEHGRRREHRQHLVPERAHPAPDEVAQARGNLVARRAARRAHREVDPGRGHGQLP